MSLSPPVARAARLLVLFATAALSACERGHAVQPAAFDAPELGSELRKLDAALKGARIVLIGENGHGVAEHTAIKVRLVEWLHREHGFDLVLFESGFFECGHAFDRISDFTAADALQSCLRYPMEHAELLPLFELSRQSADSGRPLRFGGVDFQSQGFDSDQRPSASFAALSGFDSALARRVARADTALFLVPASGGAGDTLYRFAYDHADSLKADYARAAALTQGHTRWMFRLAEAWVDRLALRGRAAREGSERLPPAYYELRDEWMARAVAAHADSIDGPAKVIVWLHNDHARLGDFPAATGDSIRSTGGFLRGWYGPELFSLGLFFGRGQIANNARRARDVVPLPPGSLESFLAVAPTSYVVLRGNADPAVRDWADASHPYLRMGLDTLSMVPGREFDALIFVDSVSVPTYNLGGGR